MTVLGAGDQQGIGLANRILQFLRGCRRIRLEARVEQWYLADAGVDDDLNFNMSKMKGIAHCKRFSPQYRLAAISAGCENLNY